MPQAVIDLSDDINRELKHYMADHNIKDKRIAITKILEEQLEK